MLKIKTSNLSNDAIFYFKFVYFYQSQSRRVMVRPDRQRP